MIKPKILVTYLLRTPLTVEPFLSTYHAHAAGIDHDFLIIDKGGITAAPKGYECLRVNDRGYDFCAFGKVLPLSHQYDYIVKLNSTSLILADHWLLKLYSAMQTNQAGIAGATGNWATGRSMSRARWRNLVYPPFPNPHIRGTGFIIAAEVFRKIWHGGLWHSLDQFRYLMEHGRDNISKRIEALGLKLLVVDKTGGVWEPSDWEQSNTFRSGQQENLLIADKQTIIYEEASSEERVQLCQTTWKNLYQA
jgi:hypothetical protein